MEHSLTPIAFFKSDCQSPLEAPRQASLNPDAVGHVLLESSVNPLTLRDLAGFSHIWLIYGFHKNVGWKDLVRPPRGGGKRGVFATRSPYRPNGLGMSCVQLKEVHGARLIVQGHDLLDGTPIFDIKPYLSYADSVPEASLGWLEEVHSYEFKMAPSVEEALRWLEARTGQNIRHLLEQQLSFEPINSKIKRVRSEKSHYVFSFRTWRFLFEIKEDQVFVFGVQSGYSKTELLSAEDPYKDKSIHLEFLQKF